MKLQRVYVLKFSYMEQTVTLFTKCYVPFAVKYLFVCYFRHWQKLRLFIWLLIGSLHIGITRMRIGETLKQRSSFGGSCLPAFDTAVFRKPVSKQALSDVSFGNVFHFDHFRLVTVYYCKMVKLNKLVA